MGVSLLPKASQNQAEVGVRFAVAEDKKILEDEDPVMKKPKKSRLGPIMSISNIGIERSVVRDGETIKIGDIADTETIPPLESELKSESKTSNNNSMTEIESKVEPEAENIEQIKTGAAKSLKETLQSLEKASGQNEIETGNNTE